MVVFPNCKINLGLNIINKREDGFHNLETVFYPLQICDVLEVMPQFNKQNNQVQFTTSGLVIDASSQNNLCVQAYNLLKQTFTNLPSIQLHLHKAIPMGAGLGGGSANAAFTLMLLNNYFKLNISATKLVEYSLQLGSDCPFFIVNKPCYATGRGEVMQTIDLDISAYKILIVNPKLHVNTAWAFKNIVPTKPSKSITQIIKQPIHTWKNELVNDFETTVTSTYPEIAHIKQAMYNKGAVYASMSGSGSTVYGLFKKDATVQIQFNENYFVQWA